VSDERQRIYDRMQALFAAADARGWFTEDEANEFVALSTRAMRAKLSLSWLNFVRFSELVAAMPQGGEQSP